MSPALERAAPRSLSEAVRDLLYQARLHRKTAETQVLQMARMEAEPYIDWSAWRRLQKSAEWNTAEAERLIAKAQDVLP